MKKEFNNLEDFIEDVSFNRWIIEKSEVDKLIWEDWIALHPAKKELLDEAIAILTGIPFTPNPLLPTEAIIEDQLQLLYNSIAAKEAAYKQPKQSLRSLNNNRIWAMAAAIALILTVTFALPYFLKDTMIEHQTAFGEFNEIQMPDGSKIVLNANSNLKYESASPRKVWLKGEAFFEIAKKPKTGENFQVLTNDLTVKVLGTTFNVKNRQEQTKVFLEEGKVLLALEQSVQQTIEMSPGELVSFSKNQEKEIAKIKAKSIDNISWKDGILRFTEAPLEEALAEISSIYGIQFQVAANYVNEERFNGGVPVDNQTIMLETLKEIYKIKIVKKGEVYLISRLNSE